MFLNKIIYLYKFISPLNLQSQLHQQSVSLSFLQIQSRHFPVLRENQNRYSLWFRWMCGWVVCLQICFSQTLQGFQSTKAHLAMLVNCESARTLWIPVITRSCTRSGLPPKISIMFGGINAKVILPKYGFKFLYAELVPFCL